MSNNLAEIIQQIATEETLKPSLLYTLSRLETAKLAFLRTQWPDIPLKRRQAILRTLVEISESNFEVDFSAVFKLGLGDEDETIRADSISGLWENETPRFMRRLLTLLDQDPSSRVRATAATALGRFIYLGEIEKFAAEQADLAKTGLLACIHREGEPIEVRRRAIEAVAYINEPPIQRLIEAAYYDEAEEMQISAIFAMGRSADGRWQKNVITELDNPSPAVRFEAARACGELESSQAVPSLVELLNNDPDVEVQQMVIWALGHIGGQAARQTLEDCLESENEAIVTAATDALEELNILGDSLELFDFDDDDDLWLDDDLATEAVPPPLTATYHSDYVH